MSLQFTDVHTKDILYSLPDKWLDYFETGYFNLFNKKYNDLIVSYGTFRLEINHLRYLETLLECNLNQSVEISDFLIFIKKCINQNTILKVYGD